MTRPTPVHVPELAEARKRLGLTQQRLAQLSDASISMVGFIERGGTCSPAMAERLRQALAQEEVTV